MFPYPLLLADVGGTNARFAIVPKKGAPLSPTGRLDTASGEDFAETVFRAIESFGFPRPRSFLLAVAGPIRDRKVRLTNARPGGQGLMIDGPDLARRLNLAQGLMLNDFEALALTLPLLEPADSTPIMDGEPLIGAPLLVIGPGTGLGVAAVLRHDERWLPVASEGGHAGIGPQTAVDAAFWPHLGESRFSAEDLLSGRGLSRLYRAVGASAGGAASGDDSPSRVTELGLAGQDQTAAAAIRMFLALLARFAGDMALALGARGGVFIGGGIAPRLQRLIEPAAFRAEFVGGGGRAQFLQGAPVSLITRPDPALKGLAGIGEDPLRFGIGYASRLWVS